MSFVEPFVISFFSYRFGSSLLFDHNLGTASRSMAKLSAFLLLLFFKHFSFQILHKYPDCSPHFLSRSQGVCSERTACIFTQLCHPFLQLLQNASPKALNNSSDFSYVFRQMPVIFFHLPLGYSLPVASGYSRSACMQFLLYSVLALEALQMFSQFSSVGVLDIFYNRCSFDSKTN